MDAGGGYGGAIYNRYGILNLTNCTFLSNQTAGGLVSGGFPSGVHNGSGFGGAVYSEGGSLTFRGTRWIANSAQGAATQTFYDGMAFGGAMYVTNANLHLDSCVVSSNKTVVGPTQISVPGAAGGGALYAVGGSVSLVSTFFSSNECQGDRGLGGATEGNGGSIFNVANLAITNCTFSDNRAIGGIGKHGSQAANGGAIYNLASGTIVGSTFVRNSAQGGGGYPGPQGGSDGASGNGGGIYSGGTVEMVNCTFFQNAASGGDGINAGLLSTAGGPGKGGGVYAAGGTLVTTNLTFVEDSATGGLGGSVSATVKLSDGVSQGGAIYVLNGATVTVINSILADSPSGSNSFGVLTDAGHNISSDDSCGFSSAGSLNNTDPKLGPLGDYGGPTETIPLLSGSPAIDAGDAGACPATDQRGISRPYGAGCDIGAFESVPLYTVNGHIRGYLSPAGVTVNIGSNSILADPTGFYTFTGVLPPGTYVVIPTAPETRIVPSSRMLTVGPDSPDTDFKAYRLNALAAEALTNSDLHVVYAGDIDATYRTLVSTNLTDWSLYSTNRTDTNGVFVITNLYNSSDGFKFLQVVKP